MTLMKCECGSHHIDNRVSTRQHLKTKKHMFFIGKLIKKKKKKQKKIRCMDCMTDIYDFKIHCTSKMHKENTKNIPDTNIYTNF